MRLAMDMRSETHAAHVEDARIHGAQVACHARPEPHVRNHVALRIDPGCDLDQLQPLGPDLEDGAFRDEQRNLSARTSHLCAVTDLFEPGHELPVPSFLANDGIPVLPRDVEITCRQGAAEDHAPGVLADVDEAADTDDPVAEPTDVDVALRIDLGKGQEREVQSA